MANGRSSRTHSRTARQPHRHRHTRCWIRKPRPHVADISILRVILGRAVKWGLIQSNPAIKPEMLPIASRTQIWTRDDEHRFLAAARPELQLAIMLMLYTLQRPRLPCHETTARVREHGGRLYIALRQQKTDELLDVQRWPPRRS
jgi:hypothetical protein